MPRSNDGRWTRTCEVCGEEFQALRKGQRTCSLPKTCRAQLPHNTGGVRARAGLPPRICQNPECGQEFIPVRASQIAHTRACLLKCQSYIEAQRRHDADPERRDRQNELRRIATPSVLLERPCEVCGVAFVPYRQSQTTHRECYSKLPRVRAKAHDRNVQPDRMQRRNERRRVTVEDAARAAIVRENNLREQLRRRYGITLEEYQEKLSAQNCRCKICGQPPNPDGVRSASRLHQDHDHETGVNRDLLCLSCNFMIGSAHDDPVLLRAAADYVERHRAVISGVGPQPEVDAVV